MALELYQCWDKKRFGHITIEELAFELISLGLATNLDQVTKLMQSVLLVKKVKQVSINQFIRIFQSDPLGDKVVAQIKKEWLEQHKEKLEKEAKANRKMT